MELRTILDWDIAPKLRGVPGVVEVNTQGGELKTYEVEVDSEKLTGYHIPLRRVIEALQKNNANAGGAYLERSEQQSLIRGEGADRQPCRYRKHRCRKLANGNANSHQEHRSSAFCPDGASVDLQHRTAKGRSS